jgi:hypothetical protein
MGGERSSTTRMRLAGKICARCKLSLPPPHTPGERLCSKCQGGTKHRVYMHFMLREGWSCQFMEEDLKTHLPKRLAFRDPSKIYEIARRAGSFVNLEERQSLDHAIEIGRGGIWLQLTEEQYQKLKRA